MSSGSSQPTVLRQLRGAWPDPVRIEDLGPLVKKRHRKGVRIAVANALRNLELDGYVWTDDGASWIAEDPPGGVRTEAWTSGLDRAQRQFCQVDLPNMLERSLGRAIDALIREQLQREQAAIDCLADFLEENGVDLDTVRLPGGPP